MPTDFACEGGQEEASDEDDGKSESQLPIASFKSMQDVVGWEEV